MPLTSVLTHNQPGIAASTRPRTGSPSVALLSGAMSRDRFSFSRLFGAVSFGGLLISYVWMTSLVQLAKRLIFVVGIGSRTSYYIVQLLPTITAALLVAIVLQHLRSAPLPTSGTVLIAFVALAGFNTLIFSPMVPLNARWAAVNERIVPVFLFFVGLAVPLGSTLFRRIARALSWSAALTVVYAVVQFLSGPTMLDAAWASAAADYSIQAQKTLLALRGEGEWRPYSYFADPLTWGLFLLATIAVVMASSGVDAKYRRFRGVVVAFMLLGMSLCLTRTPWIGLIAMLATYAMTRRRVLRKSVLLYAIIVAGFPTVVFVGSYLYENVFPVMVSMGNTTLDRYITLGTIEARIGSWDGLQRAITTYPVLGEGFGYSDEYNGRFSDLNDNTDVGMHNFAVELTTFTGVCGLALFLCFLWCVVRQGTRLCDPAYCSNHKAARWLLAFLIGSVITGYLNGSVFMSPLFYLLTGVLAGESERLVRGERWNAR